MADSALLKELLHENERYADVFDRSKLAIQPAKHLAILACMDARLTVPDFLGLRTGDAHIIRNAGGITTEDAIRSLIISTRLLGTKEFVVINHTECGMLTFKYKDLQARLTKETGENASKVNFHSFSNLEENVRTQVERIRTDRFLPRAVPVTGFVYDVRTGRLARVT